MPPIEEQICLSLDRVKSFKFHSQGSMGLSMFSTLIALVYVKLQYLPFNHCDTCEVQ